jgi:hypothetical protein
VKAATSITLSIVASLAICASAQALTTKSSLRNHQTKREAEIILLGSPKRLGHLAPALVNHHTGLLRTNTRANCNGRGPAVHGAYHEFRCTLTHRKTRLVVKYTAIGRFGAFFSKVS